MEQKAPNAGDDKIIHDFNSTSDSKSGNIKLGNMNSAKPPIVLFIILLVLGIGTGFLASKAIGSSSSVKMMGANGKETTVTAQTGQIYGSQDEKTFKDNAQGKLQKGGIDGEGAYHLVRPGGDSQNVYLTSSIIDLSQFVGKKVKVWGQTQSSQKAGWLMDVGRLQLE